jgi:hypothetical protein
MNIELDFVISEEDMTEIDEISEGLINIESCKSKYKRFL